MKKFVLGCAVCSVVFAFGFAANAATLKDKTPSIFYSAGHYLEGQPMTVGCDVYGFNYQAHSFNGSYFNAYAGADGLPPYYGCDESYLADNPEAASHWAWSSRNITLQMKWSDAWQSNQDRDGDGKLDRTPEGAWITNHQSGTYNAVMNGKVKEVKWTYFIKIVHAPADAVNSGGRWYSPAGKEIGQVIWGSYALIQEIYTDPGFHMPGRFYASPVGPGIGKYQE